MQVGMRGRAPSTRRRVSRPNEGAQGRRLREGLCGAGFVGSPAGAVEAALEYTRGGDALAVTKLDRLARSVSHLVAIGERLEAKGVALKVLDQAIDTSTPTAG